MGQDAARLQGLKPRAFPAGSVAAKAATYKAVATAGAQGTVGGGLDLREDAESNSSGAKAQRSDDRSVGAPRSWGSTEASIPGGEYISSVAKTDRSEDRPLRGSTAEASTFRAAESLGATQDTEVATAAPPLNHPGQGLLRDRRELGSRTPKSVAVQAALLTLNFYKVWLSPWLAGSCRYEPTCSRYAYEAIERFGVARGVWLGTKRLLRCHPFTKRFGYDPVPEKWEEMRREESKSIFSGAKARENGNDYVGTKAPTLSGEHILLQVEEAGRPLPSPGQAKDRRLQGGVRS